MTWVLEHEPERCFVALDSGDLERRNLDPLYKRGRSSPQPEYYGVHECLLEEINTNFADEVQLVVSPGWESDDVMATIAAKSVKAGKKCVMMTNDKDLRQALVKDMVTIQRRVRDEFARMSWGWLTHDQAEADWQVFSGWFIDAQVLSGDTAVDAIKGVERVGLPTAVDLLITHGGFEKLKEKSLADLIPGVVGKNLKEFWPREPLVRKLITLRKDCKLFCPFTHKEIVF